MVFEGCVSLLSVLCRLVLFRGMSWRQLPPSCRVSCRMFSSLMCLHRWSKQLELL